VQSSSAVTTFLFTDIEGSTRLWEQEPERMSPALARHDAIARAAVQAHRGLVVKMTGDGVHAVFDDPLDAVAATLELQQALADPEATHGIALSVRCGLHLGVVERRDNEFFGTPVNRAARLMAAAHGGQVLLSQAVPGLIADRLRDGVSLHDLGAVRLRDLASTEHINSNVGAEGRRTFIYREIAIELGLDPEIVHDLLYGFEGGDTGIIVCGEPWVNLRIAPGATRGEHGA
jgi:class 3 adenylate cyclase